MISSLFMKEKNLELSLQSETCFQDKLGGQGKSSSGEMPPGKAQRVGTLQGVNLEV